MVGLLHACWPLMPLEISALESLEKKLFLSQNKTKQKKEESI